MKKLRTTNYSLLTAYCKLQNRSLRTATLQLCLLLTAYCLLFTATSFAIITNINSGATFSTMQNAVTAATSGDTLLVSTGRYSYMNVVSKNLTIRGGYTPDFSAQVSYSATILDGISYCANFGYSTSTVEGLTFTDTSYGISIYNYSVITAMHCYVENNISYQQGAGLRVTGHSLLVLDHTDVENNSATNSNGNGNGGGVYVSGATLVVSEYSHIRNNYAQEKGGGIYISSGGYVEIKDSSFVANNFANEAGGGVGMYGGTLMLIDGGDIGYVMGDPNSTAGNGGGIYAQNAFVMFDDNFSKIINSYAGNDGGGIYLTNSSLIFNGYAQLGGDDASVTNYAKNNGGGIYALNSHVAMTNAEILSCFAGDAGGGIYADTSDVILYNCDVGNTNDEFTNVCRTDGGAICSLYGMLSVINTRFENNCVGDDGAAIFIYNLHLIVTNSVFANNKATDNGGVLYTPSGNAFAEIYNSTIITNSGDDGGAIWWYSNSNLTIYSSSINNNEAYNDDGGGVYLTGSGLVTFDNVEMIGNTAIDDGGAILVKSRKKLNLIDCDIRLNRADSDNDNSGDGGGIAVKERAQVKITANTQNVNIGANRAENGAAIYVSDFGSSVDVVSTSNFTVYMSSNVASKYGGIIDAEDLAEVNILGKVQLMQSSADNGGAISAKSGATVNMENSGNVQLKIKDCTAHESGGGIFIAESNTLVVCSGVTLGIPNYGNEAQGRGGGFGGGAVAVLDSAEFNASNCRFEDNNSLGQGGAIYISNATAIITGDAGDGTVGSFPPSLFIHNTATNGICYGGAVYVTDSGIAEFYSTGLISNRSMRGGAVYANLLSETRFVNSLIAQNYVSVPLSSGGGIRLFNATANMEFCTVANNYNSGIDVESGIAFLDMTNCIVWGHTTINVTTNPIQNVVFSDIQGGYPGTGNISDAPLLADLPNLDYELTAGSPCKNTGMDIGITNDCIGVARPQLGGYDMGCYEFIPEPCYLLFMIYNLLFISRKFLFNFSSKK